MARSPKMGRIYQIFSREHEKNGSGPQFSIPRWFRPTTASVHLVGHVGSTGRSPSSQNSLLQLHKTTGASVADQRRGGRAGKGGRPGEREISRNRDFPIFFKLPRMFPQAIRGTQGPHSGTESEAQGVKRKGARGTHKRLVSLACGAAGAPRATSARARAARTRATRTSRHRVRRPWRSWKRA